MCTVIQFDIIKRNRSNNRKMSESNDKMKFGDVVKQAGYVIKYLNTLTDEEALTIVTANRTGDGLIQDIARFINGMYEINEKDKTESIEAFLDHPIGWALFQIIENGTYAIPKFILNCTVVLAIMEKKGRLWYLRVNQMKRIKVVALPPPIKYDFDDNTLVQVNKVDGFIRT